VFDFGTLIIPSDLVTALSGATVNVGWLGGSSLASERVFVVTTTEIAGEIKLCEYFPTLFSHRSYQRLLGIPTQQLLKWIKVEQDFSKGYPAYQWFDTEELAAKMGVSQADLLDDKHDVICVIEPSDKGPRVRPFWVTSESGKTKLLLMDAIVVPETENPFVRIPAEFTKALKDKRVSIIGLGSGGGQIATDLACAGVGSLDLFDDDHLHPENYIFHLLNRRDLGRNKVQGIADNLQHRNLQTNIKTYDINVVFFANYFRRKIAKHSPDLMICATDSRDSRRFLNLCAIGFEIPLIIAGTLNAGRIGEVMLINPHQTACYECIRLQLGATLEPTDSGQRSSTPYLGGEVPDLQAAVQRFDINFVASLTTRVALQVLDPERYPKLPTDYLVWGREQSSEHAPPFRFDYPLSVNFAQMPRRADCPICGAQALDLHGIDIDEKFDQILGSLNSV
jgi:molybdopterin/thiamine biosynthesis adenylyltransferase